VQGFTGFFPSLVVVVATGFAVVTTAEVLVVVVAGVAGFVPGIVSQLGVEVAGVVGLVVTVVEVIKVVSGLEVVVVVVATSYLSSFSKLTGFTLKIKRTFPSAEVVKSAFALFTL
jgi:hypothetical protein